MTQVQDDVATFIDSFKERFNAWPKVADVCAAFPAVSKSYLTAIRLAHMKGRSYRDVRIDMPYAHSRALRFSGRRLTDAGLAELYAGRRYQDDPRACRRETVWRHG